MRGSCSLRRYLKLSFKGKIWIGPAERNGIPGWGISVSQSEGKIEGEGDWSDKSYTEYEQRGCYRLIDITARLTEGLKCPSGI